MNLGVDSPVHGVVDNEGLQELGAGVIILVGLDDQLWQPMLMLGHPVLGKRRAPFLRARIGNAMGIEGFGQPLVAADLLHTDKRAELLRQFGKGGVPSPEAMVAGLLGGI